MAGEVTTPYPTFRHLSIEWAIDGDDDLDGVVSMRFRRVGDSAWRDGMPLRRTPAGGYGGFTWGNRHSGSLFGLQPGTSYEIELVLADPDGGNAQRTVFADTRAQPAPMPGAPVRVVTPATLASMIASAQPGDILLLQPGVYPGFAFERDGEVGQPIVLRGTPGAVIDGELGLFFRRHVMLDRLVVNGRIRFNGSDEISVVHCTVNASPSAYNGDGIVSYLRSENAWIADNVVTGTTPWQEGAMGADGDNRGEGILVTGPGHVIEHNDVRGFRDAISLLEDAEAVDQFSIDILGNEIAQALDDAIEADFCAHNCRIVGNRATNAFIAFSSQPSLGGPTYFVRNAAYNVAHVAFKLYRESSGDVLLHNSVVKAGDGFGVYASVPVSRLYTRNNLFLGGPGGEIAGYGNGDGDVARIATLVVAGSSLDHDAFGSTLGTFSGRLGGSVFESLAQMQATTSETHAVEIDLATFAQPLAFPADPLIAFEPADLRLASGSAARDAGVAIPTINVGFEGAAPDAGAYEVGSALPHYGPRLDVVFADGFEGG
ncbi:MAG: right-handed parallel beta-helix repeat-containing protein [Lysobacteraceae bacterium]|nr:MAG: right-handed parallel beta-helix repeat-containing protein [Xanthomonadaceae bacterium]